MTRDFADEALTGALEHKAGRAGRIVLVVLATAVFYLLARTARYADIDEFTGGDPTGMIRLAALVYTAIFAVSLVVQLRMGRNLPLYGLLFAAVATGAVLLAKISLLDYQSDDYQIFLVNWTYQYSIRGIKEGLGTYLESDYTPPYLYLLQIVSRVKDYPWQYLIKAWSILFEVLLCWVTAKLASFRVRGEGAQLAIYHIVSLLPTVVFNGAYWGQCDVIYVALCLTAIYMGLQKRSAWSMVFFGIAISFKLHAAFFFPIMLPLWLRKDIKLRHLPLIPAAYMAMMIPALWGGKSLHHVITCHFQRASGDRFLTMNGPNFYQLFPNTLDARTAFEMFSNMAMLLGFAVVAGECLLLVLYRDRITPESVALFGALTLAAVPYFMPKIHERYTFGADVISVIPAVYEKKRIGLPLLFGLASYICYTGGLPGDRIMDLRWAALFQGVAIVWTAIALWKSLASPRALTEVKA